MVAKDAHHGCAMGNLYDGHVGSVPLQVKVYRYAKPVKGYDHGLMKS